MYERYPHQYKKNIKIINTSLEETKRLVAQGNAGIKIIVVDVTTSGGGSKKYCHSVGVWRLAVVPTTYTPEQCLQVECAMLGNGYCDGLKNVEWIRWSKSGIPQRCFSNLLDAKNDLFHEIMKEIVYKD